MIRQEFLQPWLIGSCLALLLVALCVAVSISTQPRIHEVLRAKGVPTNYDELKAILPEVTDTENAFPLYKEAMLLLEELRKVEESSVAYDMLPNYGGGWGIFARDKLDFDRYIANMQLYLEERQFILDLLYEASDRKLCRWPHEIYNSYSYYNNVKILSDFQEFSQILAVDRIMAALKNDTTHLINNFQASIYLGESLLTLPYSFAYIARNTIININFYSLENLFAIPELTLCDANLVLLSQHVEDILQRHEESWQQANFYEFAVYENIMNEFSQDNYLAFFYSESSREFLFYYMLSNHILNLGYSIIGFRLSDRIAKAETMLILLTSDEISTNTHSITRYKEHHKRRHLLSTGDYIPYINAVCHHFLRFEIVRVSIAVQRYYQKVGHYPESLEALTPEFLDSIPEKLWCTEEIIKYYVTEHGAIVYALSTWLDQSETTLDVTAWEDELIKGHPGIVFRFGDYQHRYYSNDRNKRNHFPLVSPENLIEEITTIGLPANISD